MLPAYAGMIPVAASLLTVSCSAPRVCGDDPSQPPVGEAHEKCSPRMRG